MKRLSWSPLWFLLVPYFAVRGLNVPAGIGGSRDLTNRTNAQGILALVLVAPIVFALAAMGYLEAAFPAHHPYIFALIVYVPAVMLVSAWLKGDREARYRRTYARLPFTVRAAFGLTTLGLIVAGFMAFLVPD